MTKLDRLMREGEGKCHWCDKPVSIKPVSGNPPPKKIRATEDHVYPRTDPRRVDMFRDPFAINSVLSCHDCNNRRGSMPYTAFLLIMRPEWREVVEEMFAHEC